MTNFIYSIFLLIVFLSTFHSSTATESVTPSLTQNQYLSSPIYDALDKGMSDVVSGSKWSSLFQSLNIPFLVPACIEKTSSYPYLNPFPSSKTQINICYEEPTAVWQVFYKQAGDQLVSLLNSRYPSANLKANHIVINTTVLGYFDTLSRAADSGLCDIVTSNVIYSTERSTRVNFNCPYGSSSTAVLISNRGVDSNYTTAQLLMAAPSSTISVLKGSYFETVARSSFPNAAVLQRESYEATFQDVAKNTIDGTIADAIDLIYWLNSNKQNCSRCVIKLFGNAYQYGSFVTMNVGSDGSKNCLLSGLSSVLVMTIGMVVMLILY